MKRLALIAILLSGCAAAPPVDQCSPRVEARVEELRAQLAAENAERQRQARAAARREEALRKQLEAMKSIERGILEREDRIRSEAR